MTSPADSDGPGAGRGAEGCAAAANAAVGERLRAARRRRRLSLSDVQAASGSEFRISALGAYERGERGVPVHRLLRLAEIYGVAPAALLPSTPSASVGVPQVGDGTGDPLPSFPPEAVL